jgi:glutamate-ammonia-ligase adenylyltransferase
MKRVGSTVGSTSMIQAGEHIATLAAAAADPERSSRYLRELEHRHPALFTQIAHDEERAQWLVAVFSFSHFLSEELLRNPQWLLEIADIHRTFTAGEYSSRLAQFRAERVNDSPAYSLALFRRKELLRIVLRDVLGHASLDQLTQELSNLADAILDHALHVVIADLQTRFGVPRSNDTSQGDSNCVFTVIALGKLGGRELNYSSDIDLVFLYSENGETSGAQRLTNKEFFKKVANEYTSLLSTYTSAGLCYRVDLRLRPEGSLGDVCIPLAAAKEYYSKRARDWELQMLIKARVAAGDRACGQDLLDFVEPSIYSTTLDFSTIETMSEARVRIGEKLTRKRTRSNELNVKLAPGGIRDIEFLVQCLQRLHGGREPWLRHGGTLLALARLLEKDLISSTEYSRLANAYRFLRNLEHRLQFEEDRQTHSLPSNPADLDRLARRMPAFRPQDGARPSTQLLRDLNQHLENVQAIYDRIVHAQRPLYYAPVPTSAPSMQIANASPEPAIRHPSEDSLTSLSAASPVLASRIRQRGIRRSEANLLRFLESLVAEPDNKSLLETHSLLADYIIQIFELSPFLSGELARGADLIDELRRVADYPSKRWAFEGLAAPLNDVEALRRFFRREMFRILTGSICLPESVFQTLDRTSALAEFTIARAYRIALERGLAHAHAHATASKPFPDPRGEMMVVALGRLGMREFDLGSDADLLFIIPDSEAPRQRFWTRVAEHLIEILTAYTAEGTILSLDTRLRPNGREGMLVQTESAYVDYFSTKAEAWEGIAYMKARGVAGDTERATEFLSELQRVDWRRYGQSGRSKQDLYQMRMRLQREQGQITPLKAGEGGYYDADFILMYLRLKGAGMFFKSLNTPERIEIVERMGHLERADAEFLLHATTFFRALDHALRLVTGRAESKLPAAGPEREMIAELMHRWTSDRPSAAGLENELTSLQSQMRQLFESIFGR